MLVVVLKLEGFTARVVSMFCWCIGTVLVWSFGAFSVLGLSARASAHPSEGLSDGLTESRAVRVVSLCLDVFLIVCLCLCVCPFMMGNSQNRLERPHTAKFQTVFPIDHAISISCLLGSLRRVDGGELDVEIRCHLLSLRSRTG